MTREGDFLAGEEIEYVVKIGNMTCDYSQLPQMCKELVPIAQDIQMKYTLVIVVGICNIIIMSFLAWKVIQLIKMKREKQNG